METKHTKGNWRIRYYSPSEFCITTSKLGILEGSKRICDITEKKDIKEEEANAKLIAAAPDLLECLIEAIESMELETSNVPKKWIDTVKKATE